MNIKDVLKKNNLELVTEISMKYLRVKYTDEGLKEKLEAEGEYDYDINGSFNVEISEMGFNGDGDLYLILICMDDEHFEKGDTFDIIEY